MSVGISVGVGIALLIVMLVAINVLVMRIGANKGMERITAHVPIDRIRLQAPMANYFGRTSRGYGQVRGNGALVLTDSELWFSRLMPRFDLSIPLGDITDVALVRSHLRKRMLFPLLRVSFRTGGIEDSIAWWVPHPNRWIDQLTQSMREWNHTPASVTQEDL